MATITFPASPAVNDQNNFNGRTWQWDGFGWERIFPAGVIGAGWTELDGPFVTAVVGVFPNDFITPGWTLLTHI